jgi:hypothetical protein
MRNVWLNKIDRALLWLGYNMTIIDYMDEKQKEALIIDEYLYRLREDAEDIAPLSLEEMADYLVKFQRGL